MRMKLLRILQGKSQRMLAAEVPTWPTRISELECRRRNPSPHGVELKRIALALDWPIGDADALLDEVASDAVKVDSDG